MDEPRILLVEGDSEQRLTAANALTTSGYTVISVADGESALQHLETSSFSLMITDWVLPGMQGDELITAVMQCHPVKILLWSSKCELRPAAWQAGIDGFLCKGNIAELLKLVNSLIHQ